jgi:hypothetical protein
LHADRATPRCRRMPRLVAPADLHRTWVAEIGLIPGISTPPMTASAAPQFTPARPSSQYRSEKHARPGPMRQVLSFRVPRTALAVPASHPNHPLRKHKPPASRSSDASCSPLDDTGCRCRARSRRTSTHIDISSVRCVVASISDEDVFRTHTTQKLTPMASCACTFSLRFHRGGTALDARTGADPGLATCEHPALRHHNARS